MLGGAGEVLADAPNEEDSRGDLHNGRHEGGADDAWVCIRYTRSERRKE